MRRRTFFAALAVGALGATGCLPKSGGGRQGGTRNGGGAAQTAEYQCSCGRYFSGQGAKDRGVKHRDESEGNHILKRVETSG